MLALLAGVLSAGVASAQPKSFLGFELLDLDGSHVRWRAKPGQPLIVRYALVFEPRTFTDARNCGGMTSIGKVLATSRIELTTFRREVRAAFDMWQSAADIQFVEVHDPSKAGILIGAQAAPRGRAFADVKYRPSATPVRDIERSLICFNPAAPWKVGFDGNVTRYDVRYAVAHEIGHAIGLDHAGRSGQLMSFRYDEKFRGLQAGDAAGAAALYGPRMPELPTAASLQRSGG